MGLTPPSHTPHGSDDDIPSRLKRVEVKKWRQEGNRLIAETDVGELVNLIPTDYIMTGVNDDNLPTFKKI